MMLLLLYCWTMTTGLHASLLGTLWPVMYLEFDVALSVVGVFSWISSGVGLLANLSAGYFLRRHGAWRTTAACACVVALSILLFALSGHFWILCALTIPSSLAGGIIGIAMNDYMAVHYPSRHMSWMHCMWGVGTIIGPNLVAMALQNGYSWNSCYFVVFAAWTLLALALFLIRKLWKEEKSKEHGEKAKGGLSIPALLRIRGAKEAVLTFFCYNSLEQGMMLWMSSFMIFSSGLSEDVAARFASFFFLGITIGRMLNGFLTMKFSGDQLIRFGEALIALGIAVLILPLGQAGTLAALWLIGLGCAPLCPCMLHTTPQHFGKEHSQGLMGIQIAASTLGNCILPSLFGIAASSGAMMLFPAYLLFCLVVMFVSHHRLTRLCPENKSEE